MLQIGIVDDDQSTRSVMEAYVKRFCEEEKEDLRCRLYSDGAELLRSEKREAILFLDIDMPEVDGMSLARKLRENGFSCEIVFVTNMAQYAIQGYEVNALDFMVKPIQYESFRFKMKKALDAARRHQDIRLRLKTRDGFRQILSSQILYVEIQRHKLLYHLENEVLEAWDTLSHAQEMLEPLGFALCNVCYLVNLEKVVSMKDGMVQVGNDTLKISRGKKKAFEDALTTSSL